MNKSCMWEACVFIGILGLLLAFLQWKSLKEGFREGVPIRNATKEGYSVQGGSPDGRGGSADGTILTCQGGGKTEITTREECVAAGKSLVASGVLKSLFNAEVGALQDVNQSGHPKGCFTANVNVLYWNKHPHGCLSGKRQAAGGCRGAYAGLADDSPVALKRQATAICRGGGAKKEEKGGFKLAGVGRSCEGEGEKEITTARACMEAANALKVSGDLQGWIVTPLDKLRHEGGGGEVPGKGLIGTSADFPSATAANVPKGCSAHSCGSGLAHGGSWNKLGCKMFFNEDALDGPGGVDGKLQNHLRAVCGTATAKPKAAPLKAGEFYLAKDSTIGICPPEDEIFNVQECRTASMKFGGSGMAIGGQPLDARRVTSHAEQRGCVQQHNNPDLVSGISTYFATGPNFINQNPDAAEPAMKSMEGYYRHHYYTGDDKGKYTGKYTGKPTWSLMRGVCKKSAPKAAPLKAAPPKAAPLKAAPPAPPPEPKANPPPAPPPVIPQGPCPKTLGRTGGYSCGGKKTLCQNNSQIGGVAECKEATEALGLDISKGSDVGMRQDIPAGCSWENGKMYWSTNSKNPGSAHANLSPVCLNQVAGGFVMKKESDENVECPVVSKEIHLKLHQAEIANKKLEKLRLKCRRSDVKTFGQAWKSGVDKDDELLFMRGKTVEGSYVPSGTIIMWAGEKPPPGWLLCNGSKNTPDLRNRFVLGVGNEKIGKKGGSSKILISQLPRHEHESLGDESRFSLGTADSMNESAGKWETVHIKSWSQGHKIYTKTQDAGLGKDYYPPYYRLAFIMKI